MLSARIASSIVFFVLFFLGLFNPMFFWVMPILLGLACLTGLREFLCFGENKPAIPYLILAATGAIALLADAYFFHLNHATIILSLMTVLTLAVGTIRLDPHFAEISGKCVIGTLYIALPLAIIMLIWRKTTTADSLNGQHYLIFLVLVTQVSDIGAYFTGRCLGRHKLAPRLSPGKTIEGFMGGVVFTVLLACLMKCFWNNIDRIFGWWEVIVLAIVFSTIGPMGDLAESWFKRNTGVKDSGKTFTGHGGTLDIIDSLLFTTVFYYAFLWIFHPQVLL